MSFRDASHHCGHRKQLQLTNVSISGALFSEPPWWRSRELRRSRQTGTKIELMCVSTLFSLHPYWNPIKTLLITYLCWYHCFGAMNITCTVGYMFKALELECVLIRNEAQFWVCSSVERFIFWTGYFVVLTLLEERSMTASPLIWISWHWVWWLASAYTSDTTWDSGLSLSPDWSG